MLFFIAGLFIGMLVAVFFICIADMSASTREDDLERSLVKILHETERPHVGSCVRINQLAREVLQ